MTFGGCVKTNRARFEANVVQIECDPLVQNLSPLSASSLVR